jgi:hypothetical protein
MRRAIAAGIVAMAMVSAVLTPALGQGVAPPPPAAPPPAVTTSRAQPVSARPGISALSWYVMGGVACSAAMPIAGTIVLGREMTAAEVGRSTLGCFLGPVALLVGPMLFPDAPATAPGGPRGPQTPRGQRQAGRGTISIPPPGETRFVPNEVLLQVSSRVSERRLARIAARLQMTRLEMQTFTLTARRLQRWRIDGNRSVAQTLRLLARYRGIAAAQPNYLYGLAQTAAAVSAPDTGAQYVVGKLRLTEAHRITSGDDVVVAVIDSRVDTKHPDLVGVIAGEYDALGGASKPHAHGTAMAGAIAAHAKLVGVAPKVRLLAVRTFAGEGESAEGTTFNILKGVDWAAAHDARIVNMSFAGPPDAMLRELLAKADARGIVLIAAVGNAGPRSPPLYPAADSHVIGVTATDADDKLLPQANRGAQVAVAAPGVDVLAAAPDGDYTMTSGTSVAAAHASGVAALLLARRPELTPFALRQALLTSARRVPGGKREVGAGVIDALGAVEAAGK